MSRSGGFAASVANPPRYEADDHVWVRAAGVWEALFWVLAAVVAAGTLASTELPVGRRAAELGLLGVLVLWYLQVGRRAFGGRSQYALVYVLGMIALSVAAFAVHQIYGLMFFVLYPHIWGLLRERWAAAASAVLALAIGGVVLFRAGPIAAALQIGLSLGLALLLGMYISRIIQQSAERADTIQELERTRAELASVSHEAGVLTERQRLAREIHDTLAQGFTSVLMLIQAAESEVDVDSAAVHRHLALAVETARQNLAEARSLVAALSPVDLQVAPLPEALARLVDRLGRELGVSATLRVDGTPRPLPANQDVVLLRAVQEALANVRKHAAARRVAVRLRYGGQGATLEVSDDGRGFDVDGGSEGFGLAGMQARAADVGGVLQVDSRAGGGTTVRLTLP
jgi:signal transduction histidine kinase